MRTYVPLEFLDLVLALFVVFLFLVGRCRFLARLSFINDSAAAEASHATFLVRFWEAFFLLRRPWYWNWGCHARLEKDCCYMLLPPKPFPRAGAWVLIMLWYWHHSCEIILPTYYHTVIYPTVIILPTRVSMLVILESAVELSLDFVAYRCLRSASAWKFPFDTTPIYTRLNCLKPPPIALYSVYRDVLGQIKCETSRDLRCSQSPPTSFSICFTICVHSFIRPARSSCLLHEIWDESLFSAILDVWSWLMVPPLAAPYRVAVYRPCEPGIKPLFPYWPWYVLSFSEMNCVYITCLSSGIVVWEVSLALGRRSGQGRSISFSAVCGRGSFEFRRFGFL